MAFLLRDGGTSTASITTRVNQSWMPSARTLLSCSRRKPEVTRYLSPDSCRSTGRSG